MVRLDASKARADSAPGALNRALAPSPMTRPAALDAWLLAAASEQALPDWPLDARQRAVLRLLAPAAQWHRLPPAPPQRSKEGIGPAPQLQWRNAQGQTATLQLDEQGARWTEPDGSAWRLPLDAATLERLHQAL